jgi:hypothetical protein
VKARQACMVFYCFLKLETEEECFHDSQKASHCHPGNFAPSG